MKKNLMRLVLCGSMLSVLAACGNKAADTKTSAAQESVKESEKQSEKASEAASEKAEEKKDLAEVKTETVYVGPEYVKELMDSGKDVVVLEAAWGKVEQDEAYNKAHIPGAFHVNTDVHRADRRARHGEAEGDRPGRLCPLRLGLPGV